MRRSLPLTSAVLAALLAPLLAGACTPQARYPAIDGDVATESLNVLPAPIVMRKALERVAARHLADAERGYDIMLPAGVDDTAASAIARGLGENVMVTRDARTDQPLLRVVRVWILGDSASVDVERPVPGANARQVLTVRLRSDIRGWRVTGVRSRPIGAASITPDPADDHSPPDEDAPELEMQSAPVDEPAA